MTVDSEIQRFLRQIRRKKIREPREREYVDSCDYSKTGWAIWRMGGGCTCEPANAPRIGSDSF